MTQSSDLAGTINRLARQDRGRLLAVLIARFRSFDLAEEALQDALVSTNEHWSRMGIPSNPQGWLLTVATRKAIDRLRKEARDRKAADDVALFAVEAAEEVHEIPDDRLRLIFTCCHPALEQKSRIALTLRMLGGLTTAEIARAFLDTEATMGQRLSRAKAKIANAGIPYVVPGPEGWGERLNSVLGVIYLIFNEGYSASHGDIPLRQVLCDEAIHLARLLDALHPDEPEVMGLLALLLATHARSPARLAGTTIVPLEAQERALWDKDLLGESEALLDRAMTRRATGPFQIQAAIAALHCQPGQTDWTQIALLYEALLRFDQNPVIRLNRAVALAEAGGTDAALEELAELRPELDAYQPFHAAHADLLSKAGQLAPAVDAYDRAIRMASTSADAAFLAMRRDALANSKTEADQTTDRNTDERPLPPTPSPQP